jgi:hypothetical protein
VNDVLELVEILILFTGKGVNKFHFPSDLSVLEPVAQRLYVIEYCRNGDSLHFGHILDTHIYMRKDNNQSVAILFVLFFTGLYTPVYHHMQ